MVTSAEALKLPIAMRAIPRGLERAPGATEVDDFIARAKSLGIEATPLAIERPRWMWPWLRNEGKLVKVSWSRQRSLSLFGLFILSWTSGRDGLFRRHQVDKVLMPLEGEKRANLLRGHSQVEEMVVLEDVTIDPVLAVRVEGQWLEVYRWWKSPFILPEDCPLLSGEQVAERVLVYGSYLD